MIRRDPALLASIRAMPCAWCGKPPPSDAAHIVHAGMGGARRWDAPENVAPVCHRCHMRHHVGQQPMRCDLVALVAARLGKSVDEIEDVLARIRWGKF